MGGRFFYFAHKDGDPPTRMVSELFKAVPMRFMSQGVLFRYNHGTHFLHGSYPRSISASREPV